MWSCSHSIHSPHCNIVGYSWFTRHCVATNARAQLCLYHCAVITGIIGHNIVKDWETVYQWWRLKFIAANSIIPTLLSTSHTCHSTITLVGSGCITVMLTLPGTVLINIIRASLSKPHIDRDNVAMPQAYVARM